MDGAVKGSHFRRRLVVGRIAGKEQVSNGRQLRRGRVTKSAGWVQNR